MTEQRGNRNAVREWLFRTETLARATENALTPEARAHLAHASEAVAVADQLVELARAEDARGSASAAISLYREGLTWSLRALSGTTDASLVAAFRAVPRHRLASLAGGSAKLLALEDMLVRSDFTATAALSPDARLALASDAKAFVEAVFEEAQRPDERLERARRERVSRPLGVVFSVLAAVGIGALVDRIVHAPVDYADDRPFIVTQARPPHPPTGHTNKNLIDGAFFHTLEVRNPSIRVDLGRVRRIARVEIENRKNCCKERALPLVVEVSTDGARFRTVARRTELFDTWEADFPPTDARYVRLRVDGRTAMLHLAGIHVYDH